MVPWTVKYCPKTLEDVQGHNKLVQELKDFVTNYKTQKKKALLLHGPPGIGKTCLIHALANDLDYDIVEVNASDFRNKDAINSIVGSAAKQQSLFNRGKIILVDEIDGLSGTKDRGGVSALTALLKDSGHPIIMTANDPYDSKLKSLRKKTKIVNIRTPSYRSINSVLKKISSEEQLKVEPTQLKTIARRAGGDYRAAINDLQRLGAGSVKDIDNRNKSDSIFDALKLIFKTTDFDIAQKALWRVDEDLDECFMWIDENIPKEYTKPQDLYRAYDAMSMADVFKGRIYRWQYWRFLAYVNILISSGVAVAKDEKYRGFTRYKPSSRIFTYWRNSSSRKKREAIASKIANMTHTSSDYVIQNMLPYLRKALKTKKGKQWAKTLELDDDEIEWLKP